MRLFRNRLAVSRIAAVVAVIVIIIVAGVAYFVLSPSAPSSSSTISSAVSSSSVSGFGPTNSSVLIDDSQEFNPDSLDPAAAYEAASNYVLNNVYQALVSFAGPNSTEGIVTPALAEDYTVQNNQIFTFNIRPGVTFSNNDPVDAAVVWFSFTRNLYENQGIVSFNFIYLTENQTSLTTTGLSVPWGLLNAIQNVTGLPATTNYNLAEGVLNNVLSNFNPNNATIQKIMSYPEQAYAVTGPMTFVIKLMKPYNSSFFLSDIAQWWADILDPVYIDAHGGVQANTPNSYFNLNGGPGTGPYYISSVGTGFSTILLKADPTYWGMQVYNIPAVLEPAHIPVVVINFGLSSNQRQEAFVTNQAQISYVDFPLIGQTWNEYPNKQYVTFNQVFDDFGPGPNAFFMNINPGKFPTDNNAFRLAIVHAINYTQILDESYTFNGKVYAENYLGPLNQQWGQYYDPDKLGLYSYNVPLAIGYMNQAGQQENFSLTLPNGTVIGDTSAATLPPVQLVYRAPLTPKEETEDTIVQDDLAEIGLSIAVSGVTSAQMATYTNIQNTPSILNNGGWGPDWSDPVFQQMMPLLTPFAAPTSLMNVTEVNQLCNSMIFETNQTAYMKGVAQLYSLSYNYAPFIWLPNYDNYVLIQPYVHGMVYSPYTTPYGEYWYNTFYYGS